jgi:hypothetical protein
MEYMQTETRKQCSFCICHIYTYIHVYIYDIYMTPRKRGISSRLQGVRLSFHSFVRVYTFPMGRGSWPIPGSQCAIFSFIALALLYPTVYIHHRSLSSTVTPHPLMCVSSTVCGVFVKATNLMVAQDWHYPSRYYVRLLRGRTIY